MSYYDLDSYQWFCDLELLEYKQRQKKSKNQSDADEEIACACANYLNEQQQ